MDYQWSEYITIKDNIRLQFVKRPPNRLRCEICKKVLQKARQTPCGCRVCEPCIIDYLGGCERLCPGGDGAMVIEETSPDVSADKEISRLLVRCPRISCELVKELKVMVAHMDECGWQELVCEKCLKVLLAKDKVDHEYNECERRVVKCPYCGQSVLGAILRTVHFNEAHDDMCPGYKGDCTNNCGQKGVLLRDHLKICPEQRIQCPINGSSCDQNVTKGSFMQHYQESIAKKVDKRNRKLQERNEVLSREDIRVLRIPNFKFLLEDAERRNSYITFEPFYITKDRCKMCLRLRLVRELGGQDSHLSVSFAIVKGEFDDIISWPFSKTVTITLIDQKNDGAVHRSFTFLPAEKPQYSQRPVTAHNVFREEGCFISKSHILSSTYYKDDSIKLKISVSNGCD